MTTWSVIESLDTALLESVPQPQHPILGIIAEAAGAGGGWRAPPGLFAGGGRPSLWRGVPCVRSRPRGTQIGATDRAPIGDARVSFVQMVGRLGRGVKSLQQALSQQTQRRQAGQPPTEAPIRRGAGLAQWPGGAPRGALGNCTAALPRARRQERTGPTAGWLAIGRPCALLGFSEASKGVQPGAGLHPVGFPFPGRKDPGRHTFPPNEQKGERTLVPTGKE